MADTKYRELPDQDLKGWPGGIPYIVGNEAAERFSFYGMRSMLVTYLTTLYIASNLPLEAARGAATHDYHLFNAGVYALPMVGAMVADKLLGKYWTIITLSLVYCFGHLLLALLGGSLHGMHLGLAFIALGAGGIKPCVSAHVGDQFGRGNWHLTKKVFQAFYFAVNFGSFFATLLQPFLLAKYGYEIAFGLPGVLMLLATIVFWMGRNKFIHVPGKPAGKLGALDALSGTLLFVATIGIWLFGPSFELGMGTRVVVAIASLLIGGGVFVYRQKLAPDDGFLPTVLTTLVRGGKHARAALGEEAYDGMLAVFRAASVIGFVVLFWALFDQKDSTWLLQATQMDRTFTLPIVGTFTLLPAQTGSANPILVLVLIPIMIYGVFPALEKAGIKITPIRRMTAGMLATALSFVIVALIQSRLDAGAHLHWAWQFLAYIVLTISELLVSATGLEFAYGQAPKRMKSTLMAFWYLTVTFGNLFVVLIIDLTKGRPAVQQMWLFAAFMAGVAVLFAVRAAFYKSRDYPQGE
jgi:POT family proton-dependent oligopeptide transporter